MIRGIGLKLVFDLLYGVVGFEIGELGGMGIMVGGLIGKRIEKEGVRITVGSRLVVSGGTFGMISGMVGMWLCEGRS